MTKQPIPVRRWLKTVAGVTILAFLLVPSPSTGQSDAMQSASVRMALEGPCLLPASEMRREHKRLLYEERTRAVRHGIRDPESSLTRCVACHAVHDEAGQPVSYQDERHFCRACHMQVAIAPDCFSCHRSTPTTPDLAEGTP